MTEPKKPRDPGKIATEPQKRSPDQPRDRRDPGPIKTIHREGVERPPERRGN